MKKCSRTEFEEDQSFFLEKAKKGAIFFYPTDTIYGLGGIVTEDIVEKINTIKQRPDGKFYSIVAPSFSWIEENCALDQGSFAKRKILQKKYRNGLAVLFPIKNESELYSIYNGGTIAVRILNHPFQDFVTALGQPFITTSANYSGQSQVSHRRALGGKQKKLIDIVLDCGVIEGRGSTIIDWKTGAQIR